MEKGTVSDVTGSYHYYNNKVQVVSIFEVKKLDKASGPFVKLGDELRSNEHAKKVFIPVGQAARKLEYKLDIYFETDLWKKKQAEMMYQTITVPTSEALIYGSTVCSHTVAFLFYWNLFWEWF